MSKTSQVSRAHLTVASQLNTIEVWAIIFYPSMMLMMLHDVTSFHHAAIANTDGFESRKIQFTFARKKVI
jgi:hypothetical protein